MLLPPSCVLCSTIVEAGTAPVCPLCWHRLPRILPPRCRRCGATRLTPPEGDGCAACAGWPLASMRTTAVCPMSGYSARLVRELKYGGWTALARPMGRSLASPARTLVRRAGVSARDLVVAPVPITRARRRERGFNQALLLAGVLSDALGAKVTELLERVSARRSQVHLGREDRLANAIGSFRASIRAGIGGVGREHPVLLVDDVVTTGATAAACATTLREAGWRPIGLVSFARAWQTLEPSGDSPSHM